jgi:putative redox protein
MKDPVPRIDNFRIEIDTPVELTHQHRAGVERAVHHCLIHNTLLHPPQLAIAINHEALVAK